MDDSNLEPTVMPLDLLREITNDFSEERKLGSGSFGKVYLGVHRDGKKIAVKKIYDMPELDDKHFQNEFKNLTSLRHQNIVRLVGYCHDIQEVQVEHEGKLVLAEKTHTALCLEYMPNGSLDKYLSDECDKYDWHKGYGIIKGICLGLKYLHNELKPPIYHFDLKPANILLDENMVPRIADFGMSRLFGDERTRATKSSLGTIGYLPPEYICNNLISSKFDIFSLGVVIIKIMAGRSGYFNSAEMSSQEFTNLVQENWTKRLYETSNLMKAYSEQVKICIEIGLSCVQQDRHKRPTIQDIVNRLNETETECTCAARKDCLLIYQPQGTYGLTRYPLSAMQNQATFQNNMVQSVDQGSSMGGLSSELFLNPVTISNNSMQLGNHYPAVPGMQYTASYTLRHYPGVYPGGYMNPHKSIQVPIGNVTSSSTSRNPGFQIEGPPGANLFVYHIPQEFGDQDLANVFTNYGMLCAKVFVDKATGANKCFGFVSYSFPAAAQAALSMRAFPPATSEGCSAVPPTTWLEAVQQYRWQFGDRSPHRFRVNHCPQSPQHFVVETGGWTGGSPARCRQCHGPQTVSGSPCPAPGCRGWAGHRLGGVPLPPEVGERWCGPIFGTKPLRTADADALMNELKFGGKKLKVQLKREQKV